MRPFRLSGNAPASPEQMSAGEYESYPSGRKTGFTSDGVRARFRATYLTQSGLFGQVERLRLGNQ
jgi:hypothetical protein